MCGIISYFSNQKILKKSEEEGLFFLMSSMLWVDSIRGNQSTGVIFETEGKVDHYKKAVAGWDFIQLDYPRAILKALPETHYLIGHNRAATRGDVNNSNAHPFKFKHITGVHNGTLNNHQSLTPNDVYHPVDSQHLYHAIAEEGWDKISSKVNGSFNLMWHDSTDNTIHMCKNESRPYCFAKLKGLDVLIGASEKNMLKWMLTRFSFDIEYCWTPKDNVEYTWKVDGDMVKPTIKKHAAYVAPPLPTYTPPVYNPTDYYRVADRYTNNNMGTQLSLVKNPAVNVLDTRISKRIEFFGTYIKWNRKKTAGRRTFNVIGETVDGEKVMVFSLIEGEMELDTWYRAQATWSTNLNNNDYWKVNVSSLVLHPLDVAGESLMVCVNCGDDFSEDEGVFVSNTPICLPCCRQLRVEPAEVDNNEGWKLYPN